MDELREFFNNPRPSKSQVVKLMAGATDGFCITKDNPLNKLDRQEAHRRTVALCGTDYATDIKKRENDMYLEKEQGKWESISGGLESMEHLSSFGASVQNIEHLTAEAMNEVYSKYSFEKKEDSKTLAIDMSKNEILDSIRGFPVTIIEGPTGCGKTTQVPQWILDSCYQSRKPCKIIVTQPRRIAAISISKRVAQERGWDVGGLVGYQVGLDRKASNDTRILYVTAGVLLQKLVAAKTMNEYTHVILDEVHERGQEMDFLLLVCKKLLYTVSPNVKIILMSATFNKKVFSDYFMMSSMVTVEKANAFSVKTFYLNHLNKFGSILLQSSPKVEPNIAPEMHHLVVKLLNAFEQIDQHEYSYKSRDVADLPSVLIFLPGISEIEDLHTCLSDLNLRKKLVDDQCATYKWKVLPLHSTITAEEQVRVFEKAAPGERKIILATNIAESSITVPDIKYVVDYCLMKILEADPQTNFTSLKLSWASKTNCEQRAGRAGRVRDGRVYRLVTDKFYEGFRQECAPEIMRCPLERLVLLAKMLDMGPPTDVLALAMDPPDMSNIHRTVLVLKEIGGLRKSLTAEDEDWNPLDGDITYMGRVMAKLPLDVRASKLIVLGHIFGCLNECVIMAAAMSVKNIFNSPFKDRLNAYNSKLTWADGSTSDCIAALNVYKVWNYLQQSQYFKNGNESQSQWARRFFVQMRALRDLDTLVRELRMRLSRLGIDTQNTPSPWDQNEIPFVLKVIIAGAVYPQYFVQMSQDEIRERDAVKLLGGLDPRNTVYLQNFPDDQPGPIYAGAIRKVVKNLIGDEPIVTFDKNSRKVYLTFSDTRLSQRSNRSNSKDPNDPSLPGQVVLPVYKAVKACQLKMDVRIPLLPIERARELATALEMQKMDINKSLLVPRLPDIDYTYLELRISEMINVGRFWVQYDDSSTQAELQQIGMALNKAPLLAVTSPIAPGHWCAGPYVDTKATAMHRVRVEKILPRDMVEVLFIDYGNISKVSTSNLYTLPSGICRETPPLALQCRLAEIAPSPLLDQHGKWSDRAYKRFHELTAKKKLFGKVYSVTHGVVAIELLAGESHSHISINQKLLDENLAVPAEESFDSKLNHDLRQTANDLNFAQKHSSNMEQNELAFENLHQPPTHDTRECCTDVVLKGPRSPLETRLNSVMYSSREKQVHIEKDSVNSVLLDTEPQEVYERLLVAMDVGQSDRGGNLTLRYTTLMPNLPGLPAIIALLFCPVAELRRNSTGTRYVSTLCGLGSNETGAPLFPEHDILVNVDAELTVDDIGMINHIRYLMDFTMRMADKEQPVDGDGALGGVAKIIRNDLMQVVGKRRQHVEPQSVEGAWEWRSAPSEELLEISEPEMARHADLYPLHTPLELKAQSIHELQQLHRMNEELKVLVSGSSVCGVGVEHVCKLCNTVPMATHLMRMHLYSNAHRQRELDLRPVMS